MILDISDSKQINEILNEIPKCQANEFQSETGGCEVKDANLTEPNDSSFRVRRLSRSFSIPNGVKLTEKVAKDELLFSASKNDENRQENSSFSTFNKTESKFILLRRSRSLGNIFLPTEGDVKGVSREPKEDNREKEAVGQEDIQNLTEKVEALEIEVLKLETQRDDILKAEIVLSDPPLSFIMDRPQTSPPILASSPRNGTKPTIFDRMQKSLGFIFPCTRREADDESESYPYTYPIRSRTPDPKFIRKPFKKDQSINIIKQKQQQQQQQQQHQGLLTNDSVPMKNTTVNNFITKVDSEPVRCGDVIKKLPQFIDVSGPKGPLLKPQCDLTLGRKCLVLDLDETLVHSSFHVPESHDLIVTLGLPDGSQQNIYVAKRPGVDEFLARVSEYFEVVIFTASLAHYADPVIDFLANGMNKHLSRPREINLRLYRESCLFLRGLYVKDLSRLGRKLEHTVIVDNSPASFILQPDHGIPIKSWFSDTDDRELELLHESLLHLINSENVSEWRSKLLSV